MNPVRAAIVAALAANSDLTELLGDGADGIYHQVAPRTAKTPYVIYSLSAGSYTWAFSPTPAMENDVWLVKATDRHGNASRAEDIAEQIEAALTDAPLDIEGQSTLCMRKQAPVDYLEMDGSDSYRHCGFLFRLVRAAAS